jgi:hypothetical protein
MSQAVGQCITGLPATLGPELLRAAELAGEEKSPATRRAYRADFQIFDAWCRTSGVSSLLAMPEVVAAFLAHDLETGTGPQRSAVASL